MLRLCRIALLATVALVSGCVSRTVKQRQDEAVAVAGGRPNDVEAVVRLAIALDASGDRRADTLYAPDAIVLENARVRLAAPRFAGIPTGGGGSNVTITAAAVTVEGRFAWALVDYSWFDPAARRAEAGRATFICVRRGEGWKIAHVHSSQPLPWEP